MRGSIGSMGVSCMGEYSDSGELGVLDVGRMSLHVRSGIWNSCRSDMIMCVSESPRFQEVSRTAFS